MSIKPDFDHPTEDRQVSCQLKDLATDANTLSNYITQLEARLCCVLIPSEPVASDGKQLQKGPLVDLAESLREIREKLSANALLLAGILGRLEL